VAYGSAPAFPPQPGVPTGGTAGSVPWMNPGWLAASADRERAVGVLRAGFAEGRLSQDELDDRVGRAYSARTYGELWALTADLPAGPLPAHGPVAVIPDNAPRPASWRPAAALIITALIIFTLAALITAIVTQHAQPVPFQQVSGAVPAQVIGPPGPLSQRFGMEPVLMPYIISVPDVVPTVPVVGGP
jgi:Domain of unknown function (DUF1707)